MPLRSIPPPSRVDAMLTRLLVIAICCLPVLAAAQESKELTNSLGMKLVLIPAGSFQMGSPANEEGGHADEVQHEVKLTKSFYLGATEVTQGQYLKVIGKNPSNFQKGTVRNDDTSDYPVESITWQNAVDFCRKLNELPEEKAAGRSYRLPTEAEWEYACRAGMSGPFNATDEPEQLHHIAWYQTSSENSTHPVGELNPNAWGLHDMHGNVWEWCHDHFQNRYEKEAVTDPRGPKFGTDHVVRGGSFLSKQTHCRAASRFGHEPDHVAIDCGFRVVLQLNSK
jgi:formylglycine-generating enzyme required for sulfatase activity